jgi:eukaryotic-like serine/threonine-protein kinase
LSPKNTYKPHELADRLLDFPESEWNQLIDLWCGRDKLLKAELKKLADKNRKARKFVENFQNKLFTLTRTSISSGEFDPLQIAGYEILKRLGAGSSATVYLAEDEEGMKVAIKVLHNYTPDSQIRQKFEQAHHILAGLNHPNIAKYIDGGISDDGTPYLIMEYVDGIPADIWVKKKRLGIRDRIQLFRTICKAVHFAHQNLVVHRDIKPEHVLITRDGDVKLIDFGIAKLLEPSIPDAALKTHSGLRMMTPEFASPEQVRGEPVTTGSDIYSLGVLLYLLMTGYRPYTFKSGSMLEIERIVCETDHLKPSDMVVRRNHDEKNKSTHSGTEKSHAFDSLKWKKLLSGDLDRIILMAMEKDPVNRYASALALADDLGNYLRGEPVQARLPTWGYRTRKFINRNKWSVGAVAAILIVLTGGIIGILWQAEIARENARVAEAQALIAGQVSDFLINLFEANDPATTMGELVTVDELLERGVEQVLSSHQDREIQQNLLSVLARVYNGMGIYDKSSELFEAALLIAREQDPPDPLLLADLQTGLGLNLRIMGDLSRADSLYSLALSNRRTALGEQHPLTIQSMDDWAGIHAYLSRDAAVADSLFQEVVNRRRSAPETDRRALAESLNNLAYIKMNLGENHEALRYYAESTELYRQTLGENHPDRLRSMSGLAVAYQRTGNYGRSEQVFHQLIQANRQVLGEQHPQVAITYHHLAQLLKDTGRNDQALTAIQNSAEIMQNLDAPHQFYPDILYLQAELIDLSDDLLEASEYYHQAAMTCMEIRGHNSPGCVRINRSVGEFFIRHGQNEIARQYLVHAFEGLSLRFPPGHDQLAEIERLIALTD